MAITREIEIVRKRVAMLEKQIESLGMKASRQAVDGDRMGSEVTQNEIWIWEEHLKEAKFILDLIDERSPSREIG